MFLTYVALIHKARSKNAPYSVMFPDFPGCVSAGKTIDEALKSARQGLLFHMEGLLNEGETLPEPSTLEDAVAKIKDSHILPCLVHLVPPSGQIKRINICMDTGLLAEVDHAAKLLGKNRSEFLAFAAQQMLL